VFNLGAFPVRRREVSIRCTGCLVEGVSLFRAGTMKLRFIVPGRVHPLESTAVISNSIIPAGGIKYRPLKGFP
jgi:hypothetical protein